MSSNISFLDSDINFYDLDPIKVVDLDKAKRIKQQEILQRHTIALENELRGNGMSLRVKPIANSTSTNHIGVTQYTVRRQALLHIINNPMKAREINPLIKVWKDMNTGIEYGKWVTNIKLGSIDKQKLRAALKQAKIKKAGALQTVGDLIRIIKIHANAVYIKQLETDLMKAKEYKFNQEHSGSVWYRGIEIRRTAQRYRCTINDIKLETRHTTVDKLTDFFSSIDKLLG